ncbi:MAG: M23 family metallopeptidase [Acidobacteriota bacterium]
MRRKKETKEVTSPSTTGRTTLGLRQRLLQRFHITKLILVLLLVMFGGAIVWIGQQLFGSIEQDQVRQENRLLREQNQLFQEQFNELKKRVNTVEDLSKELSQTVQGASSTSIGVGGPKPSTEPRMIDELMINTTQLETQLRDLKLQLEHEQLVEASIPTGLPVEGLLTGRFGNRRDPFGDGEEFHTGQDIAVNFGVPVHATADGIVIYAAAQSGYGNVVVIDHGNGITTRYGHLSAILVRFGQPIHRYDIIGRVGSTGRSTGPHLHYEVRNNNVPLDPLKHLGRAQK